MRHINPKFAKLLLASALTAAFAAPVMAQTSVTVNGTIDNYIGSSAAPGSAGRTVGVQNSGMTTSWLGFDGSEDLGGGLKSTFALDAFIGTDTGTMGRSGYPADTMFSRNANVGLAGNFGAVKLGRGLAPNFLPMILFNPFGDSFAFSPLVQAMQMPTFGATGQTWGYSVAGDTGWSNEVIYTSPTFSGLTANVHYQFGEKAGDAHQNNFGVNLLYFNGPISLTAFYQDAQVNNPLNTGGTGVTAVGVFNSPSGMITSTEQKVWFVGGGYDFGPVKLNATYDETKNLGINLHDKTTSLGATVPLGSGKILVGWAGTKRTDAGFGVDATRNTTTVGYDYDLSKMTDLYAMLMNDRVTDFASANSFGVGIRHKF